jgi:hypothetical protein
VQLPEVVDSRTTVKPEQFFFSHTEPRHSITIAPSILMRTCVPKRAPTGGGPFFEDMEWICFQNLFEASVAPSASGLKRIFFFHDLMTSRAEHRFFM